MRTYETSDRQIKSAYPDVWNHTNQRNIIIIIMAESRNYNV